MKKILLLAAILAIVSAGFSSTVTITNLGYEFNPPTVTIALGDDIAFVLQSIHNAQEVSQATWNANGNTPLPGGFAVPFGGGTVPASFLTVGIHYYVCVPHASMGMKGTITVINTTGVTASLLSNGISVFPNPSDGNFQVKIDNPQSLKPFELGIYDVLGNKIYSKSDSKIPGAIDIDISDHAKGTYLIRFNDRENDWFRKIIIR